MKVTFLKIKSFESPSQSKIRERLWTHCGKQGANNRSTWSLAGVWAGPPLTLFHVGVLQGVFVDYIIRVL